MVEKQQLETILANTGDMCLKRRAKILVSELNLKKGDKILDVGCGDGFYLYLISQLGNFDITGIDSDPQALKSAKKQVGKSHVKLVLGNATKMPFKNASFDKIICSEVLEHLTNDKEGLLEMRRVLKKNGVILATVPHYNFPFFWDPVNYSLERLLNMHIRSGFWSGIWNFHERLYKISEFKKLFTQNGFRIERFESLTHYALPFNHYLLNIGFRLRTSSHLSDYMKNSISKFEPNTNKTWFSRTLALVNKLDKRNDKKFAEGVSAVGLFIKAKKL